MKEKIEKILSYFPFETKAVGGWVRNYLLNIPFNSSDYIDLATPMPPNEIIDWGKENDIKVIPTGLKYGTVTVILKDSPIEITTLREDIQTDGRHATVQFGTSWEIDAKRRDFTINALYMDQKGEIFDYVNGMDDIQKRKISFIGDPEQRIKEDYLRIWRYHRFLAFYGDPKHHQNFFSSYFKEGLHSLSKERIQMELCKWFSAKISYVHLAKDFLKAQFEQTINIDAIEKFERFYDQSLISSFYLSAYKIYLLFDANIPHLNWSNKQKKVFSYFKAAFQEKSMQYILQKFDYETAICYSFFHAIPLEEKDLFPLTIQEIMPYVPRNQLSKRLNQTLKWWSKCSCPRPSKKDCLDCIINNNTM